VQLQKSYDNLERQVADRTKELATLNRLAAVVSQSLNLTEIINNALDEALEITGMTAGQAFILDKETEELLLSAYRGISDRLAFYTNRMPLGATTAGLAAQKGRPVFRKVVDYPKGRLKDLVWNEGIQLVVSIPLMSKGETLGAIDLGARSLRLIGPDELSLLAAIGHQIGVAVENAQLYAQAQQLAIVQERNRLARDLHDSVMQSLYGMTMYSEAAVRQLESGQVSMAANHLHEIQSTAQEALREMRLLIFELRPSILEQEGLTVALRSRLESVEERVGMETTIEIDPDIHLSAEIEQELYRVAQEALNNALKHANANRIAVRLLEEHQTITLEISDDGTGFHPTAVGERGGFGFRGMKERVARLGGELAIQSTPGKGTKIRVEVPQ
jgi:signal transduction histidine kinase